MKLFSCYYYFTKPLHIWHWPGWCTCYEHNIVWMKACSSQCHKVDDVLITIWCGWRTPLQCRVLMMASSQYRVLIMYWADDRDNSERHHISSTIVVSIHGGAHTRRNPCHDQEGVQSSPPLIAHPRIRPLIAHPRIRPQSKPSEDDDGGKDTSHIKHYIIRTLRT